MASLCKKKEETNWLRACKLLIEAGKELLLLFLQQKVLTNGMSLKTFLEKEETKLRKVCYKSQIPFLYPEANTDQWDITLITTVLNNCVTMTKQEAGYINNIRTCRNKVYGHVAEMKMDDADFSTNWQEINVCFQSFFYVLDHPVQFDLQGKIDNIEKEDVTDREERALLQWWHNSDMAFFLQEISNNVRMLTEANQQNQTRHTDDSQQLMDGQSAIQNTVEANQKTLTELKDVEKENHDSLLQLERTLEDSQRALVGHLVSNQQKLSELINKMSDELKLINRKIDDIQSLPVIMQMRVESLEVKRISSENGCRIPTDAMNTLLIGNRTTDMNLSGSSTSDCLAVAGEETPLNHQLTSITQAQQNSVGSLRINNNPHRLDRRPTQVEIGRMSSKIGKEYTRLGFELGLENVEIEHIQMDYPNSTADKIWAMLCKWLAKRGSAATLNSLKMAMDAVDIDSRSIFEAIGLSNN